MHTLDCMRNEAGVGELRRETVDELVRRAYVYTLFCILQNDIPCFSLDISVLLLPAVLLFSLRMSCVAVPIVFRGYFAAQLGGGAYQRANYITRLHLRIRPRAYISPPPLGIASPLLLHFQDPTWTLKRLRPTTYASKTPAIATMSLFSGNWIQKHPHLIHETRTATKKPQ